MYMYDQYYRQSLNRPDMGSNSGRDQLSNNKNNKVAKKMRTYFNRELVSFEGTFEMYLCTSKGRLAMCYHHAFRTQQHQQHEGMTEPQH